MNAPVLISTLVEPRAAFLSRAAARDGLYQSGAIELDEAFGGLVEHFMAVVAPAVCDVCGLNPCADASFCATCREADRHRCGRRLIDGRQPHITAAGNAPMLALCRRLLGLLAVPRGSHSPAHGESEAERQP